jgi:hypothetical protein
MLTEQFLNLDENDKETILQFIFDLTEGDVLFFAESMSYDRSHVRKIMRAFEHLKG